MMGCLALTLLVVELLGFEHVADPDYADITFGYEMVVYVGMDDGSAELNLACNLPPISDNVNR